MGCTGLEQSPCLLKDAVRIAMSQVIRQGEVFPEASLNPFVVDPGTRSRGGAIFPIGAAGQDSELARGEFGPMGTDPLAGGENEMLVSPSASSSRGFWQNDGGFAAGNEAIHQRVAAGHKKLLREFSTE